MGEMVVSATPGVELGVLGLGSCIGLALVDAGAGVAGLAHVVLPDSRGAAGPAPKYADLAVPALLDEVLALGANRMRLQAALAGGAQMFSFGGGTEIGSNNEAVVRAQLQHERIRVVASATGGNHGRTIRIDVASCSVTVNAVGGPSETLIGPRTLTKVAT